MGITNNSFDHLTTKNCKEITWNHSFLAEGLSPDMLHSLLALLATLSQELGNTVWALRLCFIGFFDALMWNVPWENVFLTWNALGLNPTRLRLWGTFGTYLKHTLQPCVSIVYNRRPTIPYPQHFLRMEITWWVQRLDLLMRVGWKRYSDNIRPASPWSLKGLTLDNQVMRYHCMMPKHLICWSLTTSGSIHLWPASCPFLLTICWLFIRLLLFLEIFNAHMECFVLAHWWSCRTNRRCAGPKVHDPTDALQHCRVEGAKSQVDWAVGPVVDCRRNEGNLSHSKRVIFQITTNLSDYDRTWKSLFDGVLASHEGFWMVQGKAMKRKWYQAVSLQASEAGTCGLKDFMAGGTPKQARPGWVE